VQNCLDTLLGLSTRGLSTEIDPNLVRSVDVREQRADVSLLQRITKWHPTIELTTSISDLLDEWRARISVGSRA
jgi:nucleoside-diphosphate-sugar epimerase